MEWTEFSGDSSYEIKRIAGFKFVPSESLNNAYTVSCEASHEIEINGRKVILSEGSSVEVTFGSEIKCGNDEIRITKDGDILLARKHSGGHAGSRPKGPHFLK